MVITIVQHIFKPRNDDLHRDYTRNPLHSFRNLYSAIVINVAHMMQLVPKFASGYSICDIQTLFGILLKCWEPFKSVDLLVVE